MAVYFTKNNHFRSLASSTFHNSIWCRSISVGENTLYAPRRSVKDKTGKNIVFVDGVRGVRTPFLLSETDNSKFMAYDLAKHSLAFHPCRKLSRNYCTHNAKNGDDSMPNNKESIRRIYPDYEELYKMSQKKVEELLRENGSLSAQKTIIENIFGAMLGRGFIDHIFFTYVKKYITEKEHGHHETFQLIDGYTKFLNSDEEFAVLLREKFPQYSPEQLARKIVEIYGKCSRIAHTMQTIVENSHSIRAFMHFVIALPPDLIKEDQVQILNTMMETAILAKIGNLQNERD